MEEFLTQIFMSGGVTKENRTQLKIDFTKNAHTGKSISFLHSRIFDVAKKQLQSGQSAEEIINTLADLTRILSGIKSESPIKSVGFSPGIACKNIILQHIINAKKSLDICVFTISDNDISDVIIEKYKKGISIRILTDNEKSLDEGSDILRFAQIGIPVKVDNTQSHMHHKFSIADEQELITGSFNWTKSAELYNQENIIAIQDTESIKAYYKEFEKLWSKLKAY